MNVLRTESHVSVGVFILLTMIGCESSRHQSSLHQEREFYQARASVPNCSSPYRGIWSSDSLVALCLPPGFIVEKLDGVAEAAKANVYAWHRTANPRELTRIRIYLWMSKPLSEWPPRLSRETCTEEMADCEQTHNLRINSDTMIGKNVSMETGFVSGGFGPPRWEHLVSWQPNEAWYASVSIDALNDATLDTLSDLVRTIRIGARSSPK